MNKENTKKLFDDFPEFWKGKDNPQASLMCFGFEYSDGWFDLTYKLCKDINNYFLTQDARHEIPDHFCVVQCKEKFGGLRFYITSAPIEVHNMIDDAAQKSYTICEKCGAPGKLRDDLDWWLTLCDKHYEEKNVRKT